jgi:acyl transferase domain-containing protein
MKALSGMFIEDIDPAAFDASFFNLTRADAIAMEPQQRQLLEVVYECFENGGIPIEEVSGKQIGCYVGSLNGGKSLEIFGFSDKSLSCPFCKHKSGS